MKNKQQKKISSYDFDELEQRVAWVSFIFFSNGSLILFTEWWAFQWPTNATYFLRYYGHQISYCVSKEVRTESYLNEHNWGNSVKKVAITEIVGAVQEPQSLVKMGNGVHFSEYL